MTGIVGPAVDGYGNELRREGLLGGASILMRRSHGVSEQTGVGARAAAARRFAKMTPTITAD